jgi:hypothetical protein
VNDIKPRRVRTDPGYDQSGYLASCHPTRTYLIRGANGGPVKIGRTNNISKRLSNLQPGNPDRLVCLGLIDENETTVKREFKAHNINGEWFEPVPAIGSKFGVSL